MAEIRFTDLNPHGGIGANCNLVEIGPWRILVDAGLNPQYSGNEAMPDFPLVTENSIDLILVTHSHLDHLGALPVIARRQPDAKILMTAGTAMISGRMLRNSVQVMKYQRSELGIAEYPLYTRGEISMLEERFISMDFMRPRKFGDSENELEVELYPSGHIPGAAACRIAHAGREIFFSGDIQFAHQTILDGAYIPDGDTEILVMETTRGATPPNPAGNRDAEVSNLLKTISEILKRGGSCLVPVFALGRMQEMLSIIQLSLQNGIIPPCSVYCSGLGMDIVDYFDMLSRKKGYPRFDRRILKDLGVRRPTDKIKPGQNPKEKGLYLVSSGMIVEKTPSYKLAASLVDHPENGICFIGYCDPATPGGQLKECKPGDRFYFEALHHEATVQASIHNFDLTGHAERDELLEFARKKNPQKIILTHGDHDARQWFMENLPGVCTDTIVLNPPPRESVTL